MLPSTIPTSFVPHQGSGPHLSRSDFAGAFGFLCYMLLVIALVLATGVFLYGQVLMKTKSSKDAQLAAAFQNIDDNTVKGFVRLRNRLDSSYTLLNNHVAFTGLFSAIEKILPSSVGFLSMHLSMNSSGERTLEGAGVAKSFNALASASAALSEDGRIKSAIFSHIGVNTNGTVSFTLSATPDPELVAFVLDSASPLDQSTSTAPLP